MVELGEGFRNGSISLKGSAVYYAGQTLYGSVVFNLKKPLNFTTLCIRYIGKANVSWTDRGSATGSKTQKKIKYESNEVYFNDAEVLAVGNGNKLPCTEQIFPFKFKIPFNLPSSCEGKHGNVTYKIIATMVYPDTRTEELTKEFFVVSPLDLNKGNPIIKEPLEFVIESKILSMFGLRSHPLIVTIKLPVRGYCSGQIIPVAVKMDNFSDVNIKNITFEILKRGVYRCLEPPMKAIIPEQVISSTEHAGVKARSNTSFTCDVAVPDLIPVNLKTCSIIDMEYFIRASIKQPGLNNDIQGEARIYLGMIPINESHDETYTHPMAIYLPFGPIPFQENDVDANENTEKNP